MGYITEQELDSEFLEKISYIGNRNYLTGIYNKDSWSFPRSKGEYLKDSNFNKNVLKVTLQNTTELPCGAYINTNKVLNNLINDNEIYTWSVWLKSDKEIKLRVGHERNGMTNISVNNTWKKFDFTYTSKQNQYSAFVFYILNKNISNISFYIHEPKLEKGYIVTDFSLALEDLVLKDDINKLVNPDELLKPIKKEIDSLKSRVDNGKNDLYSAIIDKKVTPKSKDFNALVQGVKDIVLIDTEQNKKYESQIKDLQTKNNQSQTQINQLKNDKSNLEKKVASIKPAKGNAKSYQVSENATFTNESGELQKGSLKVTSILDITPSDKAQQFRTGIYGTINVAPITPELIKTNLSNDQINQIMKDKEPNLKPENIANGVTIGDIKGIYKPSVKTMLIDQSIPDTKIIDLGITGIVIGLDLGCAIDNRFGSGLDHAYCSFNILTSRSKILSGHCNRDRSRITITLNDKNLQIDTRDPFISIKGKVTYIE